MTVYITKYLYFMIVYFLDIAIKVIYFTKFLFTKPNMLKAFLDILLISNEKIHITFNDNFYVSY